MTSPSLPVPLLQRSPLVRLYLVRAALAIVWAIAFGAASSQLDGLAVTLLIVYPAIDVVASVLDARRNPEAGRTQWLNAAVSTVALVALAVAAGQDNAAVLHVFGTWATVSGVIQLVVAVRRRATYGRQWAMLISGGLSTLAGIAFNVMATSHDPVLTNLAGYAGLGGVLFAVSALLVRSRATSK